MDAELAGWMHPVRVNSSVSQWRSATIFAPQSSVLGLVLFSTFINDMNSGTEFILRNFAGDTKPSGALDSVEGRDAIQKNTDRLEEYTRMNWVKNGSRAILRRRTWKCQVMKISA